MVCPKCRVDFPDDRSYRVHAVEAHGAPHAILQGDIGVVLPQGSQMISPVTDVVEFDETPSYTPTTQRPKKTDKEEKTEQPKVIKEERIEPIVLSYKYSGACPACRVEVTTVMLTVKEVLHAVALCPKCQSACQTLEVEPIGKKRNDGKRTDK